MSPPYNQSVSDNWSECSDRTISDIGQLDGNDSISETKVRNNKQSKTNAAIFLPTVATYNLRSMIPKIENLKKDIIERQIDVSFLQEIWEVANKSEHRFEIEKMLELSGF